MNSLQKRYLDHREASFYRARLGGGMAWLTQYKGKINEQSMKLASKLLCDQFPILRSRVREDEIGYWFETPSNPDYPEFVVADKVQDMPDFLRLCYEVQDNLNPRLAYFILWQQERGGYFGFGFNHAIVDAQSLTFYDEQLWKIYTDIVSGRKVPQFHPESLPQPMSEMISSQSDAYCSKAAEYEAFYSKENRNQIVARHVKRDFVQLGHTETNSILDLSRKSGVTVSSLLTAFMALTIRDSRLLNQKLPFSVGVAVNQRNYLDSQVQRAETTTGIVKRCVVLDSVWDGTLLDVAKEFQIELKREIQRLKRRVTTESDSVDQRGVDNFTTMRLNSSGKFPDLITPVDVQVINRFGTSFHPDYPASNLGTRVLDAPVPLLCAVGAFTVVGRLNLILTLPDPPGVSLLDDFLARCRNPSTLKTM